MKIVFRLYLILVFFVSILQESVAQSNKLDSVKLEISSINNDSLKLKQLIIASSYFKRSHPKEALQFCSEGIELSKKNNNAYLKAVLLNRKGLIKMSFGDYTSSSLDLFEALYIFDSLTISRRIASSYNNIGILYKKQGRYEDAMNYYRLSVKTYGDSISSKQKAVSYNNFGIVHKHLKQYDSALLYFNEALLLNEKENKILGMSNNEVNMANVFRLQKKQDLAIVHYQKALVLKHKMNDQNGILKVRWNMTVSQSVNSSNSQIQLAELKTIGDEAKTLGFKPVLHGVCEDLATIYARENNYDSAYKYLMLAQKLNDSLVNAETSKQLGDLTFARLQQENTDKMKALKDRNAAQAAFLESEKSFNQFLLVSLVLMFLLVLLVVWLLYQNQLSGKKIFKQKEILRKAKENTDLINANLKSINKEKELLVSLIAHDLKSPIDQIKGLIELTELDIEDNGTITKDGQHYISTIHGSIERVYNLISKIVESHRNKRNVRKTSNQNLYEFVEGISHNFEILAKKKAITINNEVDKNCTVKIIDADKLTRIIENLLSNSIKYTLQEKKVILNCTTDNNITKLHIIDEGPGLSSQEIDLILNSDDISALSPEPTAGEKSHGIGLVIVKQFINELDYKLEITSEEGKGCTFSVVFN